MMQDRVKLLVKDCVKVNNVFYCIAKQFNLIFSLDVNTGKVEILSIIPDNAYEGEEFCGCITFYKGELYIGTIMSNTIWIFNIIVKRVTQKTNTVVIKTSLLLILNKGKYIINANKKEITHERN